MFRVKLENHPNIIIDCDTIDEVKSLLDLLSRAPFLGRAKKIAQVMECNWSSAQKSTKTFLGNASFEHNNNKCEVWWSLHKARNVAWLSGKCAFCGAEPFKKCFSKTEKKIPRDFPHSLRRKNKTIGSPVTTFADCVPAGPEPGEVIEGPFFFLEPPSCTVRMGST